MNLSVETHGMCLTESQDVCLVETQDMCYAVSYDVCSVPSQYKGNHKGGAAGGCPPLWEVAEGRLIWVGCEHRAYLSFETWDMCLVESQDVCLVETQEMWCAES